MSTTISSPTTPRFYPESDKAEVYGLPGVRWQQRGYYFTDSGRYVAGDPDKDRELDEINGQLADPKLAPEAQAALRARKEKLMTAAPPMPPEDQTAKSDELLKKQLEIYGEKWTTRKAALKFLQQGNE
jgi:hypothetical protein